MDPATKQARAGSAEQAKDVKKDVEGREGAVVELA